MNPKYFLLSALCLAVYFFYFQFFEAHSITKSERSRSEFILKKKQTIIHSNIGIRQMRPHQVMAIKNMLEMIKSEVNSSFQNDHEVLYTENSDRSREKYAQPLKIRAPCPTRYITTIHHNSSEEFNVLDMHSCQSQPIFVPPLVLKSQCDNSSWASNSEIENLDLISEPKKMISPNSSKCLRYAIADTRGNGLGHRHGSLLFVADLASEFGFTVVLGRNLWASSSQHGSYLDFKQLVGLDSFMYESELDHLDNSTLPRFQTDTRESFILHYRTTFQHTCNIIVRVRLGGFSCRAKPKAPDRYCFGLWPGSYERARRFLQPFYPPLNRSSLARYSAAEARNALTVAWHVRCGDVTLMRSDSFFTGIHGLIAESGVAHQHFIFNKGCKAFAHLPKLLPNAVVINADVTLSFSHLKGADVLVHTGSSFASAAAAAAPNPQLYFQSPPKEAKLAPGATATYALHSAIEVGPDGALARRQHFAAPPDSSEGWQASHRRHVVRLLQALHARKAGGPRTPDEEAAAADLQALLSRKVLAGAIAGASGEVDVWARNAALAEEHLPGWAVRLYYKISLPLRFCALRARANVELVDMSGSALPSRWWPHQAALDRGAGAVVFAGPAAAGPLSACELRRIADWMRCGRRDALALHDGCTGRDAAECVWGVRGRALPAARGQLELAMDGADPAAGDALLRWIASASGDSDE